MPEFLAVRQHGHALARRGTANEKAAPRAAIDPEPCYTSTIVVAQLAYWVRTKEGRQREALQEWLSQLLDAIEGRILGFSVAVAHVWAAQQLMFDRAGL